MNRIDKVIWLWLSGNDSKELRKEVGTKVLPHTNVWAWVFEKDSLGRYVRAQRCLNALRLRSKAYRRAGVSSTLCAEAALTDLAGHMGRFDAERAERC